jgi:putative oxidoreductase
MNGISKTGLVSQMRSLHQRGADLVSAYLGGDVLKILARLALAGIFWRSFLTKVELAKLFTYTEYINDFPIERARLRLPEFPFEMKASTLQQFNGDFALPLIPGGVAAWMATLAEFVFPIFLVLGILTRLSALALLGMTLVIQIFVYPDAWWVTHSLWVVISLYIVVHGPGRLSLDQLASRFFAR